MVDHELDVGGEEGRRTKNWENCVTCCCTPSQWIHFIAWTHILFCTLTIVMVTLAMLVTTGAWGDILWLVAALLFIPLALSLPILPAFLLFALFTNTFPNIRGGPQKLARFGELSIVIWMEVIVFAIFVLMSLILLKGFKEKKSRYLMAWLWFAGVCILMIVVETIFFMASLYFGTTFFDVILNSMAVLRLCLAILPLLWAMGAVQMVRREILDKMAEDEDEEDVDEYLDLQLM